jgi:polysaccharide export outer membrane protein
MFGTKDFDQELRVSNTGEISLPLIGALSVAGLSPTQTAQSIGNKLIEGHFYNHPQLSVFVREYATAGLYVLGEVQKPGSYSILTAHNVLQAISLAGGTTPKAGRTVSITNPNRPHSVTASLNIAQPENSGAPPTDPVKLLSGDTLVVSKAGIVYVVGDVRTPSGIVMDNPNLTVVEAIALAQGTNPTASLDRARLIRRGPDGPKEIAIPLKKMLAAEVADMPVQADDVIFVPTSKARTASRRGLEAILQAATGVAMYARY